VKIKHYLIASETNNYNPWITSSSALVFFLVVIWGLRLIVPQGLTLAQSFLSPSDIMNRINSERSSRSIPTVATNTKLITAAQQKSDDMLARSYFSHIDPDGNYVWPKIEAAGYKPYTTLGENLAMDFSSPEELVAAWMNSPTHRANLLNEKFKDQGLALSSGKYEINHDTTIVVSLFGALTTAGSAGSSKSSQVVNNSSGNGTLTINSDAQIGITQVSGHNLIDLSVSLKGAPTLVTAKLLTQSITLLKQSDGRYAGTFTFNLSDDLSGKEVVIEARDSTNAKVSSTVTLADVPLIPNSDGDSSGAINANKIPVSQEAAIFRILRIIFGILASIYLGFLVIDWVIMKRAHVERPGMLLSPRVVVFLLIAFVNIFAKF
jgi:hypothetical protein